MLSDRTHVHPRTWCRLKYSTVKALELNFGEHQMHIINNESKHYSSKRDLSES